MTAIVKSKKSFLADPILSFDVWDLDDTCPHCGSVDVELTGNDYDVWYECMTCNRHSGYAIDDREVEDALNRMLEDWLHADDREDLFDNLERG